MPNGEWIAATVVAGSLADAREDDGIDFELEILASHATCFT
jgi:hypothetical protein